MLNQKNDHQVGEAFLKTDKGVQSLQLWSNPL